MEPKEIHLILTPEEFENLWKALLKTNHYMIKVWPIMQKMTEIKKRLDFVAKELDLRRSILPKLNPTAEDEVKSGE
jgi:hypothetical protein